MANNVEPEVLVNSVLGRISDILLNGDGEAIPRSDDHFLAFMSPGIPMLDEDFNYALEGFGGVSRKNVNVNNPADSLGPGQDAAGATESDLAADAAQKYMRAEAFYAMTDLIPDTKGIIDSGRINTWNPENRISSVYAQALQMSQVYNTEPDEATKAKIDRWRGLLQVTETRKNIVTEEEEEITRESPLVTAYNEKHLNWLGAAIEYNNVRIAAMKNESQEAIHRFAANGVHLQTKLRAALADWSTNGFKGEFEQIAAAIQSVEERSYVLLKQRYKEDFARSVLTNPSSGANFLYTAPAPASFARGSAGWSEYTFNKGSFESNYKFKSSTTSAGASYGFGPFRVGGSGKVSKQRWDSQLDTQSFSMSFKLCRVPIYRPWFHLDFIKSGFWRYDASNVIAANAMVSDGKTPPNGLMPAITTECIFVRDLFLHFGESHRTVMRKKESSSGGGGFAFGPFHAGGRHTQASDERSVDAQWESQGIRINGIQLLGFMCHMLPKAPDPRSDIQSWI